MADNGDARDLYRRWINELWNGGPGTAADVASELVTDDFVGHWPDRPVRGARALADVVTQTHEPFGQLTFVITVGPLVDGNHVAGRWAAEGENADGPARFFGNDIVRVHDGKIAEYWAASSAGSPDDQEEPGLAAQKKSANDDVNDSDDDSDNESEE